MIFLLSALNMILHAVVFFSKLSRFSVSDLN